MVRENGVQSQVESYQRFKRWYLMPPCLTISIIRWGSRVNWSTSRNGVAPSPTPWCSSYWKGSLWVILYNGLKLYLSIVSTRPVFSKSSSHFTIILEIVQSRLSTTGITIIFMFHRIFSSFTMTWYLSLFSISYSVVCRDAKVHYFLLFFFFFDNH